MINQKLLNKELEFYKEQGIELKPLSFNNKLINSLFNNFSDYGMTESSYCCYGEEVCCWQEIIEEGNWDSTLNQVKDDIKKDIKYAKKYLYNQSKYGKRLYMYKDKDCCYIYIYLRDLVMEDYSIWFNNIE